MYGITARNEIGRTVEAKLTAADLLEETGEVQGIFPKTSANALLTSETLEKLDRIFEHSLWEEVSQKCLECGACTYVCPACHCFDLVDAIKNARCGFKIRAWDSCMFAGYTLMAGGHNPRQGKKNRLRQRFMHKLCYGPGKYGRLLCTGCGRCLEVCPVHIDIGKIIRQIKEAVADA